MHLFVSLTQREYPVVLANDVIMTNSPINTMRNFTLCIVVETAEVLL